MLESAAHVGIPNAVQHPWLDAEIGSTLTSLSTTAAARLAELLLDRGDLAGVLEATARGLAILPADTDLFALRMRAAAAAGDRAAVKAEYEAYLRAEQADPPWDDDTDRDLQQAPPRTPARATAGRRRLTPAPHRRA